MASFVAPIGTAAAAAAAAAVGGVSGGGGASREQQALTWVRSAARNQLQPNTRTGTAPQTLGSLSHVYRSQNMIPSLSERFDINLVLSQLMIDTLNNTLQRLESLVTMLQASSNKPGHALGLAPAAAAAAAAAQQRALVSTSVNCTLPEMLLIVALINDTYVSTPGIPEKIVSGMRHPFLAVFIEAASVAHSLVQQWDAIRSYQSAFTLEQTHHASVILQVSKPVLDGIESLLVVLAVILRGDAKRLRLMEMTVAAAQNLKANHFALETLEDELHAARKYLPPPIHWPIQYTFYPVDQPLSPVVALPPMSQLSVVVPATAAAAAPLTAIPEGLEIVLFQAAEGPVSYDDVERINQSTSAIPFMIDAVGFMPADFAGVCHHNPQLALTILQSIPQKSPKWIPFVMALLNVPISVSLFDIVHSLALRFSLPDGFIGTFLARSMSWAMKPTPTPASASILSATSPIGSVNVNVNERNVSIVCKFVHALVRDNVIQLRDYFYEVQNFATHCSQVPAAQILFQEVLRANATNSATTAATATATSASSSSSSSMTITATAPTSAAATAGQ
ncbi:hypothetical protein GQ42DRAFT_93447 [Ramicandelaber brevisporus]|nr:hypothetical protein GQ42DRAFT_93447 [Ramicandelaber brevisporus]